MTPRDVMQELLDILKPLTLTREQERSIRRLLDRMIIEPPASLPGPRRGFVIERKRKTK